MTDRGRDWRSILLGIASLAGALSAFAFAGLMIVYAVFGLLRHDPKMTRQLCRQWLLPVAFC